MSMIGKVRRMHFRQGKSVREIARLTSLSRNTIRSWLREPEVKERSYRRPPAPTQLTPFAERLQPYFQHAEQGTQRGLRFETFQIVAAWNEMPVLTRRKQRPHHKCLALVAHFQAAFAFMRGESRQLGQRLLQQKEHFRKGGEFGGCRGERWCGRHCKRVCLLMGADVKNADADA